MKEPSVPIDQNRKSYFRALCNHCSAKPDAVEAHPWGETVFKVHDKVFAFLGTPERGGVGVKVAPEQIDGLLALPFVERSPYIGRFGWLSITITDDDALELAQELIDASYEMIASEPTSENEPGPGEDIAISERPKKKSS
jgi:predicted DNA-binding protein (MmcQ/YjbR family)